VSESPWTSAVVVVSVVAACAIIAVTVSLLLWGCAASSPPVSAVPAPGESPPPEDPSSRSLFDGRTLGGWDVLSFGGDGVVAVEDGCLALGLGEHLTGVRWTGGLPASPYEITLEAMRVEGGDFFCGLTFPIAGSCASLIVGGWGGGVCGLSSLDGFDASENETTSYRQFESGTWYPVRLRVSGTRIDAWVGGEQIVGIDTAGKRVGTRIEVDPCKPLGFASWRTKAALRNIRWRPLDP
jgi:hypothetical protein